MIRPSFAIPFLRDEDEASQKNLGKVDTTTEAVGYNDKQ